LIQAFSRTNRIMGKKKSQGNVVCFRNLKKATDEAVELFANKDAVEVITLEPYENYAKQFEEALEELKKIAPTVDSVDELLTEDDEAGFVQAFRQLMRLKNTMGCFTEFSFDDISMDVQEFEDYKSKYLDLYDKVKNSTDKEKVSVLEDIDFELELLHIDVINVAYIIALLRQVQDSPESEKKKRRDEVLGMLDSEPSLRSKKTLIEKFIKEQLPKVPTNVDISSAFEEYWNAEKDKAVAGLSESEALDQEGLQKVIGDYMFTEKVPLRDDVISIMKNRPSLKERGTVSQRVIDKIKDFVETFIDGIG